MIPAAGVELRRDDHGDLDVDPSAPMHEQHHRVELAADTDLPGSLASLERGCAGGDPFCCDGLAHRYGGGWDGFTRDAAKSRAFYAKACKGGLTNACAKAGGEEDVAARLKQVRSSAVGRAPDVAVVRRIEHASRAPAAVTRACAHGTGTTTELEISGIALRRERSARACLGPVLRFAEMRPETPRGQPFPEIHGEELVRMLLAQIDEEEQLGAALGVDLTPPAPDPSHAPPVYAPLDEWLRRSDEVHAFLEERYRAERREPRR